MIAIGLVAFAICVMGLVDPVGTQMADDSNPFGTPPPASRTLIGMLASAALVCLGWWLRRRSPSAGSA